MAWSAPITAVANSAFTAAQFNASVRDNLNETAVAKASAAGQHFVATGVNALAARTAQVASIATQESTTSTSFTDLATTGPAVTVTSGTMVFIFIASRITNNTANVNTRVGFAVTGASTEAGNNDLAMAFEPDSAGQDMHASLAIGYVLNAGSNAITMKYKVDSASTGTFSSRRLSVIPF